MQGLPSKGDTVVYGNLLYNRLNNFTYGKAYEVQEDSVRDTWVMSNGIPYHPTIKVALIDDNGKLVRPNLCRFYSKAQYDHMMDAL